MTQPVLIAGGSGYIANLLIPRLLDLNYRVRALARHPPQLEGRGWFRDVETVPGDVMEPATLASALSGVGTAYYLIHNMASGRGYTERELEGAHNFASAAETAGVEHIIYLGGLADPRQRIAPHLRSRIETGKILRAGRVPVTEFRAGVIVGSGSISFEMIRFITELFPVIPGPAWLNNLSQPIAAQNVVDYLAAALENPGGGGRIFEIGGPEIARYKDLMLRYARLRGHKRSVLLLPGIPLWFMALGVGWMTPVPRPIAHALIGGLSADSVVKHKEALQTFPEVRLIGFEEAAAQALAQLSPKNIERVWDDGSQGVKRLKHEGFFVEHRRIHIHALPQDVFSVIKNFGENNDWYPANWLWRLRGWINLGVRKLASENRLVSENSNSKLLESKYNFHRVDAIEENRLLLLHSLLKIPGEGWLEWRLEPAKGGTRLTQTSFFAPRGLPGFAHWYLLHPFHNFVLQGLIRAIARRAEGRQPG